jgi:hypothetical protein
MGLQTINQYQKALKLITILQNHIIAVKREANENLSSLIK